jgi:hypothetical protein
MSAIGGKADIDRPLLTGDSKLICRQKLLQNLPRRPGSRNMERAWDALVRYQTFLATGEGLPTEDGTKGKLMESNNKLAERLRLELDELRQEQLRRRVRARHTGTSLTSR